MSDPNYPAGVKNSDIDNIGEPMMAETPPEIRNVEYRLIFNPNFNERIHISGNQISWLGCNVHEIRSTFYFLERKGETGDEGEIERLENFIDFICKEFEIEVSKKVYMTDSAIVRM